MNRDLHFQLCFGSTTEILNENGGGACRVTNGLRSRGQRLTVDPALRIAATLNPHLFLERVGGPGRHQRHRGPPRSWTLQ